MNLRWIPAGNDRLLAMALGTSIVLHAVLLAVHFKFPAALRWQASEPRMEVVLVNAKTRERPSKAEVLAQANLDRGGNVDERRRARSPLPVTQPKQPGRDLAEAQRRVRELEARQQELLSMAREAETKQSARGTPAEQAAPQPTGRDLADLALAALRLQAQIDKQIDDYQKRPRKKFIGANAAEYRFAQYEEDWRAKVERWGTVNYPAEARGKLYGNLRLTVTIRPDGSVEGIELDRSSGLKVLDAAAFKIVKMAGPFAAFPASIRRDTDLLVITRTWFFGQGDKIWTE
ncbi:MAG: TonB family protein [Betaproteobacteria bacterium]|nr:MAG: TonB family protein [Betaproteobacteria bacterium]